MARLDISTAEHLGAGQAASADIFFELGVSCATGRGGVADLVTAHKWLNIAAFRGSADAARYRQELAAEMSREEIAEAQRAAREWLSLH